MFGIYRTILAIFVVLGHLGTAPYLGTFSVFGFYILSGYLMTRIMQRTYGYSPMGLLKYFTNRFLRIFPIYWVSILISLILIYATSTEITKSINDSIYNPETTHEILQNTFIVFSSTSEPRLTPPSWALSVELFYYILIAFGISKNKTITLFWFIVSGLYTIYLLIGNASFSYRYFTIPAASLPFSIGAMIFFLQKKVDILNPSKTSIVIIILLAINYFVSLTHGISHTYGFYINLILCASLIFCLSEIKYSFFKLDSLIGSLSYPIYLMHFQCGIIALLCFDFFNIDIKKGDYTFFVSSIFITFFISYFINNTIESKIELIRNKIRPSKLS